MIATRVLPVVTLTLLSCLAACSSAPASSEETGQSKSAIIHGKASDSSQDAVVLLIHYDPSAQGVGACSGTLIAPNLVLTARHCVADTDESAACKDDGTPIAGGVVRGNHDPSTLYVFTGADRPDFSRGRVEPAGTGKKIFDDGGKNLCNHDMALVLLDKPIANAQIAALRLDGDVEAGELFTAIGWGVTDTTTQPNQRQQRKDIKILNVGPNKTDEPVPPNEFEVGEAICSGDSGGPAIAEDTNSIVGVVSRGGNAQASGNTSDPASNCTGSTSRNLYTKVSPFKDLIMKAFDAAGAEPWVEGGPDPRKAKDGEACSESADCRSAACIGSVCAEDCSQGQACTNAGDVCTAVDDAQVCRPKKTSTTTTTTTCSTSAPGGASTGAGASVVFGLLALASLRRKRR